MNLSNRKWLIMQIGMDAVLINLAAWIAWYIRYELQSVLPTSEAFFYQPYRTYIPSIIIFTILIIYLFRYEGVYASTRDRRFLIEMYNLINGTITAILLIMAFTFFIRPLVYSRAFFVYTALSSMILLALSRAAQRYNTARQQGTVTEMFAELTTGILNIANAPRQFIHKMPKDLENVLSSIDSVAWLAGDALLINVAIYFAWYIRYNVQNSLSLGEGFYYRPYEAYLPFAFLMTVLVVGIFLFEGLYLPVQKRRFLYEAYSVLNSTTTAILLAMAITFLINPVFYSRAVYIYATLLITQILLVPRAYSHFNKLRRQRKETYLFIELTADIMQHAQGMNGILGIVDQFAGLPLLPTIPEDLENVLPPIREIAQYAQAAQASDTLYNKQTQLRNAVVQTQRVREGLAQSSNRQIEARFGRALETWEQVFGKELNGLNAREVIPNVYVAGSPLATASKVFKGRHDLFVALERELASQAESRPTLLLFGARRSGKTSAIKQMSVRLGPDVIPVEVDLQSAATAEDVSGLLSVVADQIKRNALTYRRVQLSTLTRDDLRADPYVVFGDWLNRVEEAVGTRWILLNLDEYERLTEMMDAGRIDQRVFDFLRGIIQHHPRVTVLLSGSHTLEDLPLIWSDYLINVRVLKIENLKEDEARELIVKPIENFPLQYEPAAVDRIIAATGCQPYLLQATCRDLVNLLNEENRTTATLVDADRALDSVLTTGVAYFQELWAGRDTDDTQRAAMRAIATNQDPNGLADPSGLNAALRKLVHRDILTATDGAYQFRVELVRRWVERDVS